MSSSPHSSALTLASALADLPAVRADRAAALSRLEVLTVADLIRHLPMRYERQEAEATVADLVIGAIGSARGEVSATRLVARGKLPRFEAVLIDHTMNQGRNWAEAAREGVLQLESNNEAAKVTASFGVSALNEAQSFQHALAAAETACRVASYVRKNPAPPRRRQRAARSLP